MHAEQRSVGPVRAVRLVALRVADVDLREAHDDEAAGLEDRERAAARGGFHERGAERDPETLERAADRRVRVREDRSVGEALRRTVTVRVGDLDDLLRNAHVGLERDRVGVVDANVAHEVSGTVFSL